MKNQNLNDMEEIGKLIRSTRKAQGMSQEDLAGLSNTGRRFISDLENGKPNMQISKFLLVIAALGLSMFLLNKWNKKDN